VICKIARLERQPAHATGNEPVVNMELETMSPRMQIVWDVLEHAQAHHDHIVIAACRRAIIANRAGQRSPVDLRLIYAFNDQYDCNNS
jgi:hypothetical protein